MFRRAACRIFGVDRLFSREKRQRMHLKPAGLPSSSPALYSSGSFLKPACSPSYFINKYTKFDASFAEWILSFLIVCKLQTLLTNFAGLARCAPLFRWCSDRTAFEVRFADRRQSNCRWQIIFGPKLQKPFECSPEHRSSGWQFSSRSPVRACQREEERRHPFEPFYASV